MKKMLFLLCIAVSTTCFSQPAPQAEETYKNADKELNDTCQQILVMYKSDTAFIRKLKKAQHLWIRFRDAELEMKFPEKNKQVAYGSAYSTCAMAYLTEMTEARTEKLKTWINGIEEGDVCRGSVR